MDNRKAFQKWLNNEKKMTPRGCKIVIMNLESEEREHHIFSECDPNKITNSEYSGALSLYLEFLSQTYGSAEKPNAISEQTVISEPYIEKDSNAENALLTEHEPKNPDSEATYPDSLSYIVSENNRFASVINQNISRITNDEKQEEIEDLLAFDITSGRYLNPHTYQMSKEMQRYEFFYDGNNYHRAFLDPNCFYYSGDNKKNSIASCASAFYDHAEFSTTIIKDSIEGTLSVLNHSAAKKPLCLVPDNLGDFGDEVKKQLKSMKNAVVQVPRSIVAAYYYLGTKRDVQADSTLLCLDYNTRYLCRTEIRIENEDDNSGLKLIRMRRQQLKNRLSFGQLAELYLTDYCRKYDIHLSSDDQRTLILSLDIVAVLKEHRSIVVNTDAGYKSIGYDPSIANCLKQAIEEDMMRESSTSYNYIIALSDLGNNGQSIVCLEDIRTGIDEIVNRIEDKAVLWEEYLPKLELETVHNGQFEWISLIPDDFDPQKIFETSMDEEFEFSIENNKTFFSPNQKVIYLPLRRDELGSKGLKDKLAKFEDAKLLPLRDNLPVELKLTYRYGDPDSYKLTASAIDDPSKVVVSHWCNEAEQIMGNDKVPDYSSPVIKNKTDIDSVLHSMNIVVGNLSASKINGYLKSRSFQETGFHNWKALREMNWKRLSLPILFSPNAIDSYDDTVISEVEYYLETLVDIYYRAERHDFITDSDFLNNCYYYIKNNILDQLSMMGGFLTRSDRFDNAFLADEIASCVLDSNNLLYILQLSTHIARPDNLGVWKCVDDLISSFRRKDLDSIKRTIGSVCWRNETWIYEFGQVNPDFIKLVIDSIILDCSTACDTIEAGYDTTLLRDWLETLLSLSRLKDCNSIVRETLDCNSNRIKEFVSMLKDLNRRLIEYDETLAKKMVGRVMMNVPDEFRNVNSVLYPLIEILTDGNAIKLTGFSDDGSDISDTTVLKKASKESHSTSTASSSKSMEKDAFANDQVEEKLKHEAHRLVKCLDVPDMSNERMMESAKFLSIYEKVISMLEYSHPEIARGMRTFGKDYMSSVSYLKENNF